MKRLIFFIMILLFSWQVSSLKADHIISNSEDWQDVYSTLLYAHLIGADSDFLTSTAHGRILLNQVPKSRSIGIVSSKKRPFVPNYNSLVRSSGFEKIEEISLDNPNLELIERIPEIKDFIIVDDSYGYNSIAVVAYALKTKSWVFLANKGNIDEIVSFINRRGPNRILIYGYVDAEVSDALQRFNPKIINTGDRFLDNVEIVKEFKKLQQTKQVILTNGEFIEKGIFSTAQPSLFTGKENVPKQIADYLKSSDIEVGVLIGNDLVNAATNIRRTTGISVMVKFAQSARSQTSGVAPVEGLDLFYLPSHTLSLSIYSIKYNKASSSLEVTYNSNSNLPLYFQGTLTLRTSDGQTQRVSDSEPIFMAPDDYKTINYPNINIRGGESISVEVFTLYGEVPSALDRILRGTYNVTIVDRIDKCDIELVYLKYTKQTSQFSLKVKNPTQVKCYIDVELFDLNINRRKETIGTDKAELIEPKKSKIITIEKTLSDEDLKANKYIWVTTYYGEDERILIKNKKQRFELLVENLTFTTKLIIALVIILILIILFIIYKRRKEEDW